MGDHVRYYEIAGITVQVESDLPITDATFDKKFVKFRVEGPGVDTVVIRHHFGLPTSPPWSDGPADAREVYRKPPWAIHRAGDSWVYQGIAADTDDPWCYRVAVFSADHSQGDIYTIDEWRDHWLAGGLHSLTMFPTDQIFVARLLADRGGCLLHSGGLVVDGHGLLFVGHSGAGKSTTMQLAQEKFGDRVEILCDDRNIVRSWPDGFRNGAPGLYVHGAWSHGDIAEVSSAAAPLRAILLLEQHRRNDIALVSDRRQTLKRLLPMLVKPLVTADWWQKELDVLQSIVEHIPCYVMRFDKSGQVMDELEDVLL